MNKEENPLSESSVGWAGEHDQRGDTVRRIAWGFYNVTMNMSS
jgi:hypothetical protein